MLIQIIKGNLSGIQIITALFAMAFVVFCTLPIHEWAHAFAAHKLGDDTAKNQGRLTINPVVHIDWLGAILIFLVGFGYAKPEPINSNDFKKRGIFPLFIKLLIFYSFPQHFLYFFPLPQGHGSFGLTFPSGLIIF